jgi:hypothetical protein
MNNEKPLHQYSVLELIGAGKYTGDINLYECEVQGVWC